MNNILNPRWLYVINTLPLLLFGGVALRSYLLVESLLDSYNRQLWLTVALSLSVYTLLVFVMAVILDARKRVLRPVHLALLFVGGVGCMVQFLLYVDELMPWSIPRWLADTSLLIYLLTFLMPTVIYCLLATVICFARVKSGGRNWLNFVGALLIPALLYLVVMVGIPLRFLSLGGLEDHLLIVGSVVATTLFLFLILRGVYTVFTGRRASMARWRLAWLIPLSIAFPVLGLAVNNGHFGLDVLTFGLAGEGVFGNFSHPIFYLMAVANGVVLCLPRLPRVGYRIGLFVLSAVGLAFVTYFLLVFLPYLPLSVPMVLFFGLGLLTLTPLLLFPVQLLSLLADYRFLRNSVNPNVLQAAFAFGLLVLPTVVTVHYLGDRHALHDALAYVYAPADYGGGEVDRNSLARVLDNVRQHKQRGFGTVFSVGTPYLSQYYSWIVLDNLTLSTAKANTLAAVFLGEPMIAPVNFASDNRPSTARLTDATITSTYDADLQQWSSWVDLQLTGSDESFGRGEYETTFTLPPGVFVDDYYLYVGDRREHGILAERRSATWVYNQIVGTNLDPGLLRYVSADQLRLNIFPFDSAQVRRSGIHFLHPEPISLNIDGRELRLGDTLISTLTAPITSGRVTYVPDSFKRAGARVQRSPQPYFILNRNTSAATYSSIWQPEIEVLSAKLPAGSATPKIVLAGTYVDILGESADWYAQLGTEQSEGFFAQRAIEKILTEDIDPAGDTYPLIFVIGESPIYPESLSPFAHLMPESDAYYSLSEGGYLYQRSLRDPANSYGGEPVTELASVRKVIPYPSRLKPEVYLPDDGRSSLLVSENSGNDFYEQGDSTWASGLYEYGKYLDNRRKGATGTGSWLGEVRGSFSTGIMMPTTAFIVVENEAQKEALRRKQAEVLKANPTPDLGETQEMAEPGWWIFLLLLGLAAAKVLRGAPSPRRRAQE